MAKKILKQHQYRPTVRDLVDNLDYMEGVYDNDGNEIIKPLTEEEKQFLNKFNQEYYHDKTNGESRLHKSEHKKELMDANNHSKTDFISARDSYRKKEAALQNIIDATEDNDITILWKTLGVDDGTNHLIDEVVDEIKHYNEDEDAARKVLRELLQDTQALLNIEIKHSESLARKAKAEAKKLSKGENNE